MADGNRSTQDLVNLLQGIQQPSQEEKDTSQYRYVLYTRKSTDEKENQVRSLPDQIIECQKYAEDNGINYDKDNIIQEACSAKESEIRPLFKAMLEDIKRGKYDGILCWHPDRLARNMKEAGEIIDLLDKEIIKDLKFKSFTFTNNPSGKMLLGITFVLSKEYSDALSENVKRGNRRSLIEGKYLGRRKHGYFKDKNQLLRPDNTPDAPNFELLTQAWKMRLEGKTLVEIANFLNENHYSVPLDNIGHAHKEFKMTFKILSEICRDPLYAGVLVYGDENPPISLSNLYDFIPMISVEEFLKINKTDSVAKVVKQRFRGAQPGSKKAELMNGLVICSGCGEKMVAGITPKKTSQRTINYYYFRCDGVCARRGKSVRAKVILVFINDFLESHKPRSRSAYDRYVSGMQSVIRQNTATNESTKRRLLLDKSHTEKKIQDYKDYLVEQREVDQVTKKSFLDSLGTATTELEKITTRLNQVQELITNQNRSILAYTEFLELFDKLPATLRQTYDLKAKDNIIRKIFLNLVFGEGKVVSYQLNPPFDTILENTNFLLGGPRVSVLEPIPS